VVAQAPTLIVAAVGAKDLDALQVERRAREVEVLRAAEPEGRPALGAQQVARLSGRAVRKDDIHRVAVYVLSSAQRTQPVFGGMVNG
jgi:hypothetical protein